MKKVMYVLEATILRYSKGRKSKSRSMHYYFLSLSKEVLWNFKKELLCRAVTSKTITEEQLRKRHSFELIDQVKSFLENSSSKGLELEVFVFCPITESLLQELSFTDDRECLVPYDPTLIKE